MINRLMIAGWRAGYHKMMIGKLIGQCHGTGPECHIFPSYGAEQREVSLPTVIRSSSLTG